MRKPFLKLETNGALTRIWFDSKKTEWFQTPKRKLNYLKVEIQEDVYALIPEKWILHWDNDKCYITFKNNMNYNIFETQTSIEGVKLVKFIFETKKYEKYTLIEKIKKEIEDKSLDVKKLSQYELLVLYQLSKDEDEDIKLNFEIIKNEKEIVKGKDKGKKVITYSVKTKK